MGQEDSPERGEAMNEKRWDEYINEILFFVKFKYDHKTIRRELQEHMEDLYEDLMAEGMDEAAAAYMTVEYMGEAAEIGQELDKEHHALLGWVWRVSRAFAIILIVINVIPMINLGIGVIDSYTGWSEYTPAPGKGELWRLEVNEEFETYDDTLVLHEILYYPDETLDIRYMTKRNPFAESIYWGSSISTEVFDKNGERIPAGGGGWKNGGYFGRGQEKVKEIPVDAKELIIYYGNALEILVDLETGEVREK